MSEAESGVDQSTAYHAGRAYALAGKPLERAHKLKPLPYYDRQEREEFERGFFDAASPKLRDRAYRAEARSRFSEYLITQWIGPLIQSACAAVLIYFAVALLAILLNLFGAHISVPDSGDYPSYDPPLFRGLLFGATIGILLCRQYFVLWGGIEKSLKERQDN